MDLSEKRYEQVPHTADLAARVYGKNIHQIFENAAYAMFDIMADTSGLGISETVRVETNSPDNESLLISWLNELLYLSYHKEILFREFKVVSLKDGKLTAEAMGERTKDRKSRLRSEIKAATYHALDIKKTDFGYEITIVFDV